MQNSGAGFISISPDGSVILRLRVAPNAKQTKVEGIMGSQLKLRIHAPPVDGKANKEVIRFLAETLKIRKSQISITAGETSKDKTVQITGIPSGRDLNLDLLEPRACL